MHNLYIAGDNSAAIFVTQGAAQGQSKLPGARSLTLLSWQLLGSATAGPLQTALHCAQDSNSATRAPHAAPAALQMGR